MPTCNQRQNRDDAYAIGLSFAECLSLRKHGNNIVVGRDGRLSSPAMATSLCKGLIAGGAKVIDIGCGPTPMLYYANEAVKADANVTLWLVEDSAHVDALWEYSSDYESRIVNFFTNSLESKS